MWIFWLSFLKSYGYAFIQQNQEAQTSKRKLNILVNIPLDFFSNYIGSCFFSQKWVHMLYICVCNPWFSCHKHPEPPAFDVLQSSTPLRWTPSILTNLKNPVWMTHTFFFFFYLLITFFWDKTWFLIKFEQAFLLLFFSVPFLYFPLFWD